ncbi:MAG: hypothetical protein QNI84_13380 [Henriciella sp.]|nr:hypothetical protein [Henriciella sp.]
MTVVCIKKHSRPHPKGGTRRYYPGDTIDKEHIKAALEDGTAENRKPTQTRAAAKKADSKAKTAAPENKANAGPSEKKTDPDPKETD